MFLDFHFQTTDSSGYTVSGELVERSLEYLEKTIV